MMTYANVPIARMKGLGVDRGFRSLPYEVALDPEPLARRFQRIVASADAEARLAELAAAEQDAARLSSENERRFSDPPALPRACAPRLRVRLAVARATEPNPELAAIYEKAVAALSEVASFKQESRHMGECLEELRQTLEVNRERAAPPITAGDCFETVRDALPGELIPLLALALCAEICGDLSQARLHYETVADTAPALGAAGLGLARTHLLAGRRAEAVAAAERLAGELQLQELRAEHQARIAVVRLLAAVAGSCRPVEADLMRARQLTDQLRVGADAKLGLRAEIQYGSSCITGDWLALSEMIPELARLTANRPDFYAMVDLANGLRPPIEWWWQHPLRRSRERRGQHVS
jgi:tetratricopeptide (TPR) repeat protein